MAKSSDGARTILIVDDDEAVRKMMVRILTAERYQIVEFAEIWQALNYVEWGLEVDLVVTDLNPGDPLSGADFARRVHAFLPEVPFLIVTGTHSAKVDEPNTTLLLKPFRRATLVATVKACLSGSLESQ